MPPNTVKVCRPGPWGNPFPITKNRPAEVCVALYRGVLEGKTYICTDAKNGSQSALRKYASEHLHELRGKNLACWCKAGTPCHADALLALANKEISRRAD